MAQILSSEKIGDRPQKSGRRYVRYKFVAEANDLSTEEVFIGPRLVDAGTDTAAEMAAFESKVLNGLALQEGEQLTDVNQTEDLLPIILSPKWATTKQLAKFVLLWMMREKDPRIVIYLEPFILHLQANYNAAQIGNLLDMTTTQVQKLNRRVNAILQPPATATSAKDLLADFDADEEEIA